MLFKSMVWTKKDVLIKYRIAVFLLIIIVAVLLLWEFFSNFLFFDVSLLPELSVVGYVPSSVAVEIGELEGTVKLRHGCYELSMAVDKEQAISINNGINRVVAARPSTHDLINDMLRGLGIRIIMVKITEAKRIEGSEYETFFAKLFMRKGTLVLGLDSRPSDALAIAARTDYEVPIYLNETLLKDYGEKVC